MRLGWRNRQTALPLANAEHMSSGSASTQRPITVRDLQEMKKRGDKIVVLTAYDALFAQHVDAAGVDIVLVGDSLGQVLLGYDSTLPVTLDEMIHHGRAARRGVKRALLVIDMPFLTFQISVEETLRNAGRVLKETGAEAVKLEGGDEIASQHVRALVRAGIPVMGHIGLTPQSVHAMGGYRVQGREEEAAALMKQDAQRLSDAGCFSMVLELIPAALGREISSAIPIPTIGIGAGPFTDGQVLVLYDMLGLNQSFQPKFLRRFAELGTATRAAVTDYADAVRNGTFPNAEQSFE
jgi:3-methyl-2-oxobutanoate hydroxymethyltransferase